MTEEKEIRVLLELLASININLKCIKMAMETSNLLLTKNESHVSIIRTYEDAVKKESEVYKDLIKTLRGSDDDQ